MRTVEQQEGPRTDNPPGALPRQGPRKSRVDRRSCGNGKQKVNSWSATCTVKSGQARSVTDCGNGETTYGKWVGRGRWRFAGECGRYFIVARGTQGRWLHERR